MVESYVTPPPAEQVPPEAEGLSWLHYGAGAMAVAASAYTLARHPHIGFKVADVWSSARIAAGNMDILARERVKHAIGRGMSPEAVDAAARPAATKALNPRLFESLEGLLAGWERGIDIKTLRGGLEPMYGKIQGLKSGARSLSVEDVYKTVRSRTPGDPYNLKGFSIDPMDAERLKRSVDLGLIDKGWAVDQGIFTTGDRIVDATSFMPSRWPEKFINAVQAFTGGFLTDTLLPLSHFMKHTPDIAQISTKGIPGIKADTLDSAFKIGSDVFAIDKLGKYTKLHNMEVGPIGNAISRAHAARRGLYQTRTVQEMKEAGLELSPLQEKIYRFAENDIFQGIVGVGPQYSEHQAVPKQLMNWYRRHWDSNIKPISMVPGKSMDEVWDGMSWADKVRVATGRDTRDVAHLSIKDAGEQAIRTTAQIQELRRLQKGAQWQTTRAPFGMHQVSAQENLIAAQMGDVLGQKFNQYYAYRTDDMLKNLAYATVETPFRIAEAMFGFGLKPDKLGRTVFRSTVGLPAAGFVAWEGSKYLDYITEETTGFSPIKTLVKGYAEAQIARQNTLNLMGISYATSIAKEVAGIDLDSPFSNMVRALGLPIAGAALGKRMHPGMGRHGFYVGAGLALLTANDDLAMDAGELRDIYEGRQEVAVRKSRGWMLGTDPYEGGDASYYRPHMVASILSDAAYTESQYGSKSEYWSHGSMLPTPHNLFGVGILADPYYYERKHYYDRPYPVTGGLFKEFPIWGNALDATVGSIIKPKKVMHERELAYWMTQTPEWSGESGMKGAADRLALQQIRPQKVVPRIEGVQDDIGHAIYDMTEYAGLKGFLLTTMKEKVSGSPDFSDTGARWAMADDIYSRARDYYDMQIGGLMGYTELFRRFLPHRQKQIDYVNPLANAAPSWLPGKRSEFGDTDYIDFHHGDPYTKLPEATKRLPGAAYEALHELHSGKPGQYDAYDRMRVLADVAPYSNAFKYYKNVVDEMADSGQLDGTWLEQYKRINARIMGRSGPRFDDMVAGDRNLTDVTDRPLNWTKDLVDIRIPWIGTKLMSKDVDPLRDYEEKVVYDNDFHDWRHPISSMAMPFMRAQASRGMVSGALGGATFGALVGATGSPIAGTVAAAGAIAGGVWGAAGVDTPEKELRRRNLEEYFDKLRFLKLNRVEEMATRQGDMRLASRMAMLKKRTVTGLDYNQDAATFYKSAYSSLPKRDRAYLQAFTEADPRKYGEILDTVPQYMRPILTRLWEEGGNKQEQIRKYAKSQDLIAVSEARDFVNSFGGVPDDNWEGWHPDIDLRDVKLKTIQNLGADIHNFGFWGVDERDVERTKPYIRPLPFRYNSGAAAIKSLKLEDYMVKYGFDNTLVSMIREPSRIPRDYSNVEIQRDRMGDIVALNARSNARF